MKRWMVPLAMAAALCAHAADSVPIEEQLAQAKAQIAEYDKLLTQAEELMNKQLPAIKAEIDAMQAPLAVGDSLGSITTKDGREFSDATVVDYRSNSVTIRQGNELVLLGWEQLPVFVRVRLGHAILAAMNTAAPSAVSTAEPAAPVGDHVYIGPIALRVVEEGSSYTYYAWTAKVGNPTEYAVTRRPDITFLDKDGFKLEDALGESDRIPPKSFRVLTGKSLMKTSLWKQIDKYEVQLVDR